MIQLWCLTTTTRSPCTRRTTAAAPTCPTRRRHRPPPGTRRTIITSRRTRRNSSASPMGHRSRFTIRITCSTSRAPTGPGTRTTRLHHRAARCCKVDRARRTTAGRSYRSTKRHRTATTTSTSTTVCRVYHRRPLPSPAVTWAVRALPTDRRHRSCTRDRRPSRVLTSGWRNRHIKVSPIQVRKKTFRLLCWWREKNHLMDFNWCSLSHAHLRKRPSVPSDDDEEDKRTQMFHFTIAFKSLDLRHWKCLFDAF